MKRIIYESRGMRLDFSDNPNAPLFVDFNNFKPNNKSGIFETERVYNQNGITTYNANLTELRPRLEFILQGHMLGSKNRPVSRIIDQYRTKIADIMNPLHEGTLTYFNYDKVAVLTVRPTAPPAEGDYDANIGELNFAVDFYSDSAFWHSRDTFKAETGYVVGGTTFPIPFPITFGRLIADTQIFNPSTSPIYPVLTFNQNNNQPEIENKTTGRFIRLEKSIQAGQKLVVNTELFSISANLYQQEVNEWIFVEDVSHWISSDSADDFMLAPGDNALQVNSAAAGLRPACEIEWRIPFEAV